MSRGRAGTPEKRKLRLGFLSKTCPVNGGCAGGPGEELAQPHRRSPALSLKDPSWSPNPEPSSYKALPLLSPAKPPSVAMTTGAGKAGAPRALPHHPLPSCSLQLGPGLRASRWLQPSPASETPAPSYWAWPQPPPAQKARRRAPTPAPPTPHPRPLPRHGASPAQGRTCLALGNGWCPVWSLTHLPCCAPTSGALACCRLNPRSIPRRPAFPLPHHETGVGSRSPGCPAGGAQQVTKPGRYGRQPRLHMLLR